MRVLVESNIKNTPLHYDLRFQGATLSRRIFTVGGNKSLHMMDSNKMQLCRLCLQNSGAVVNIWEIHQDSSIASIMTKHFWFQVNKDDGLTQFICDVCWIQTKTFHQFYKQIEQFQKCFYDSIAIDKNVEDDAIANVDCADKVKETELNIVNCEKTELRSEAIESRTSTHDDFECNDLSGSGQSDTEQSGDEEDQSSNNGQKGAASLSSPRAVKKSPRLSPSEKAELEGQIRDLFKMNCEICSDVTFRTLLDANKHYRSVHQKSGYIMCCGKTFHDTCRVVEHMRYHIDLDANGPPEEEEAEIRDWFVMKCDICSDIVEFQTLLEMQRHYRKKHKTRGYLRSSCCDKKLHSRSAMVNHIRWHTNSGALRCGQCDKTFKCKFSLTTHIANHTPHDSRKFNCTLCPSRFALAASLKSHVKNKHEAKTGEKFNCDKCTKSFRSGLLLSHHIRYIHAESRTEYVCEVCARTFKSKTALQNHFDCFHSSKPPPKVQCDICGVWLRRLNYHRRLHERANPVNCPICNKVSPSKEALSSHIKYVHGEKRHQCKLCNKAFACQKNLQEHLATHTNQDLYNCQYCEKKFKSNANMYKHRKSAHLAEWTRDAKNRTMRKTATNEQAEPEVSE